MKEIKPRYVGLGISAVLGLLFLMACYFIIRHGFDSLSPESIVATGYFTVAVGMAITLIVLHELGILYQYYALERDREIHIDFTAQRILVRKHRLQEEVIAFQNIHQVLLHNRPMGSRSLTRDLEYAQISYGNNKTLLMTSLRMDNDDLKQTFASIAKIITKERKPLSRITIL